MCKDPRNRVHWERKRRFPSFEKEIVDEAVKGSKARQNVGACGHALRDYGGASLARGSRPARSRPNLVRPMGCALNDFGSRAGADSQSPKAEQYPSCAGSSTRHREKRARANSSPCFTFQRLPASQRTFVDEQKEMTFVKRDRRSVSLQCLRILKLD